MMKKVTNNGIIGFMNGMKCMKRNVGIELLRVITMYQVVILHVLLKGEVIAESPTMSAQFQCAWFIKILAYCAVNTFAIISGYVGYKSRFKVSKIIKIWSQVSFYTVLMTFLWQIRNPLPISNELFNRWESAILPITTGQYWFITAYIGVYILSPILNAGIEGVDKNTAIKFCGVCAILCSVVPCVLKKYPYDLGGGYSVTWLTIMYVIGGLLNKYDLLSKISKRMSIITFIGSSLFVWGSKVGSAYLLIYVFGRKGARGFDTLVSYVSPFIVLNSICLLRMFIDVRDLSDRLQKLICCFASASLGVYLIHVNPIIWNSFPTGFAQFFLDKGLVSMIVRVFGVALCIYLICTVIELFRIRAFRRLRIDEKLMVVEERISESIEKRIDTIGNKQT